MKADAKVRRAVDDLSRFDEKAGFGELSDNFSHQAGVYLLLAIEKT